MQNRSYVLIAAAFAAGVLFIGATRTRAADGSSASQTASPANRLIRVSGTAVIYGKPDYANIVIGVAKLSPRAMDSKKQCDDAMRKVQDSLRKAGVAEEDIQTSSYEMFAVQPQGKPL